MRRVIVDDSEGLCATLDEAMQRSVDAYSDPWAEADAPVHGAQFETTIATVKAEALVPRLRAIGGTR